MPLKAPPPALSAGRRVIEDAFKDLERTISPAESRDFASTTLDDVRRAAVDLERQLAARQSLRNMRRLAPFFQGLHHYSKVIDVLCNGTDYLPWIWAPIKLILKISSDYMEAFDRIIKAYSQIAESLGRFRLLEMSFEGQPHLYPVFVIFYADILHFHKAAYKFITRQLIDKEVNAHNIIEARAIRETLKSWRAESLSRLAQEQKQQTARQMQGRHPGTVDWILRRPQVASWLRPTSDTPFLWLQGAPGTGKSVIVAQLVSFLVASRSSLVVRHFYSYTHDSSTHYDQIIKTRQSADLVAHIQEEYVGRRQAAVPVLEKLLEIAVDLLSGSNQLGIHILLDRLDKCPIDKQRRLLRLIERFTSAATNYKVLLSSRNTSPFPERLRKSALLLAEEKVSLRDAIARYAGLRLLEMRDRLQELGISDDDTKSISSHIGERADGMFLWATLVLNYLSANCFYTCDEFIRAIDTLPRELTAFYKKLLSRILSNLDTRSAVRLRAIFGWIAFARRPLRKAELQSAIMFQSDESISARPVPAHILDACKPLIEERRNSSLAFIHISVKETIDKYR
ncbi:hypothetical protein C8A01DRAFT_51635 [Parachaetomium inaequale]|uniref:NACHT domain-containing protein n=1 Tax=Parachaetomium inaequale TaxID=2588326 RepID=A0AAN6P671_9PEZI|nr:hypothetical protein C8A01DRAFT_51635 [Parachaetomium inaequale]